MVLFPPQEINSVIVNELQQLKFSQLYFHEKVSIKKRGRLTFDIKCTSARN